MRYGTGRRTVFLSLFAAACLGLPAYGADTEQREYLIYIDGKEAGTSRLKLTVQDDGSAYMTATVSVKFKKVIINYALDIEAQEWWKGGKLVGMKTSSTENGKKTEVTAAADAGGLRVRVGGQERAINPDVWTTSYWKLADAKYHDKAVPLLDVDTGKEYPGRLQFIAAQQLKVGSDLVSCYHFRVTGGPSTIDLWFDPHHRLVRQEFTDLGHRTLVVLSRVQR